ncbi:MAG: LamG domain-containing protein [Pirellulales bacterium]|nr:LamG domain-containing protein [Pirellulales bacterium]
MRTHFALILAVSLASTLAHGSDISPLIQWTFDDRQNEADQTSGNAEQIQGVAGKGLKCDGMTTCLRRGGKNSPRLSKSFTVEAWVTPQTYPWNWCPIVAQNQDRKAGFYFGIDADGHLGLHVAVGKDWKECVSRKSLPLMRWSHVAGSFDPEQGIRLYIDGKQAAHLPTQGAFTTVKDVDIRIARNARKMVPAYNLRANYAVPSWYSFDGILDEIKIHGRCLTPAEIAASFSASQPVENPLLKLRRLPSGPEGVTRFGAFYEHLNYDKEWDSIWRGSGPDVVVGFDIAPIRLVFWRGISYAPCWITENGNWFCNEFMERSPGPAKRFGCCESMSDKQARYSHVKVLESSEARAVVYWRYNPCDIRYDIPYVDETTGWGDWAEEYHTIYPDGVAVRKVVMYSSNWRDWHEWSQSLPIMHPGQKPEDILDPARVLSLANMAGESRTYAWPAKGKKPLPKANIQVVHYKSQYQPFLVMHEKDARIWLFNSEPSPHSKFSWWNHWPVAQIASDGRNSTAADRPSHSCTSTQNCAAYKTEGCAITKIMLCGLTKKSASELVPLARSWSRPPMLSLSATGYKNHGHDPTQRAYVLECQTAGQPQALSCRLEANAASPAVNPALLIRNWGAKDATVTVGQKPLARGSQYRLGHVERLEGGDLIVWLRLECSEPMEISLTPVP